MNPRTEKREFDFEASRGRITLYTAPMGGGKSDALIEDLTRFSSFSRYKVLAFGHVNDTKAGQNAISSRTGLSFPALKVQTANELYDQIQKEDNNGFVDLIGIDELLYFGYDMVPVLLRLTNEGRVVLISSLCGNFRGEPIPLVTDLASFDRTKTVELSALCQVEREGKPCSRTAYVSMRLYPRLANGGIKICHDKQVISRSWSYAPYYAKTIEPQPNHDPDKIRQGEPFYVAACDKCFSIPGKVDTLKILARIKGTGQYGITSNELRNVQIEDKASLNNILAFLIDPSEDRQIRHNESDRYFYRGPQN